MHADTDSNILCFNADSSDAESAVGDESPGAGSPDTIGDEFPINADGGYDSFGEDSPTYNAESDSVSDVQSLTTDAESDSVSR